MLTFFKRKFTTYSFLALCWVSAYFFLQFLQFEIMITPLMLKINRFRIVLMGSVLSFLWEEVYQLIRKYSRRFPSFTFFVASYSVIGLIIILGTFLFVEFFGGWVFYSDLNYLDIAFYRTKPFLIVLVYSYCVMFGINFIREIDRKLGRGNLLKFIIGRYFMPHEEQRIFLFMDLKSSTYYAEQLGHYKYSRLLQDCFHDLTPVVEKNNAEIYQYVGDEVVITWAMDKGFVNNICLQLYFDFQEKLEANASNYIKKYGYLPYFKAGIHAGRVTVAEVGDLKREIAYHGDAINTASRIQGLCNEYKVGCLISYDVLTNLKIMDGFHLIALGSRKLRGKKDLTDIYTVTRKESH